MTLQELDSNGNMSTAARLKLSIHHSNLFHPRPPAITNIALGINEEFLAVTRQHTNSQHVEGPLNTIIIYRVNPNFAPKIIFTIIEHEELKGIVWINKKTILTVSKQQTINLYNLKVGLKSLSLITDYGPILCLKYIASQSLLFTGTEYGYVATYHITPSAIEPVDKMVKTNGPISSLDLRIIPEVKEKRKKSDKVVQPPTKKLKRQNKDESENDATDDSEDDEEIKELNIAIYGACRGEVIAWDYCRKTIVETIHVGEDSDCNVLSLLVLENGNIVTGDSKGIVSIFDQHTFTCRQSTNVLQHGVLALAKDLKGHCILASGEDPTIVMLKRDRSEKSDFVLFEKVEFHTHDVTAMTYVRKNDFITSGKDGLLARFKVQKSDRLRFEKIVTLPNYSNNVKFSKDEIMLQYDKELVIWKLPKDEAAPDSGHHQHQHDHHQTSELNPVKLLLIKARTFIHSSTFNDRWICYSTKKDLHIFSRSTKELVSYRPEKRLSDCTLTELCFGGNYLAACAQGTLFLVELKEQQMANGTDKTLLKCRVLIERQLGQAVKNLINFEPMNALVALCGTLSSSIYTFKLNVESEKLLEKLKRISLKQHEISFITYNGAEDEDSNIYGFTNDDQLFKFDPTDEELDQVVSRLKDQSSVAGLPPNTSILGMVMVSKDYCILYDNNQMYKVDVAANKVVNQNSDYRYIIRMDNSTFDDANHVALVELTPADYRAHLPPVKPKKKFGQ